MEMQQRLIMPRAPVDCHLRLLGKQVVRVEARPGRLTVIDGRVWLTRRGDGDDHVLVGGQHIALAGNAAALLEAWDAQAGASVHWQPVPQALPRDDLVAVARRARAACGHWSGASPPRRATPRRAPAAPRGASARVNPWPAAAQSSSSWSPVCPWPDRRRARSRPRQIAAGCVRPSSGTGARKRPARRTRHRRAGHGRRTCAARSACPPWTAVPGSVRPARRGMACQALRLQV